MRPTRPLRPALGAGLLLSGLLSASPELDKNGLLTPADRLRLTRLLVPRDANMAVHELLPEVELLTATQLEDNYRDIQTPRYLGIYDWMDLGVNFVIRSNYPRAIACYEKLDARTLSRAEVKMILAWLHERVGKTTDALRMYEEIIRTEGGSIDVYYRKACCELTLFRSRAAGETINNMLQISRTRPDVLHLKGLYEFMQGDLETARQTFTRIIADKNPDLIPETYLAMAVINLHLRMAHDASGWLHLAMQSFAPSEQVFFMNLRDWRHIHNTEAFTTLVALNDYPYFREGLPEQLPQLAETAGARFYRDKFSLPESLRVSIHLRKYDPYTRVRTLKGKLNVENY